jgi:predicted acyl esterase
MKVDRLARWVLVLNWLLLTGMLAATQAGGAEPGQPQPKLHLVPMSDGIKLATDVYLPSGEGPWPVVFLRGPYGRSGVRFLIPSTVRKGYALVSQDVRGRGGSQGSPVIIFDDGGQGEHKDGHESLAWIAAQPWCNGKIGSMGGSALGITQNMQAPGAPEALSAQVVEVACSDFYSQGAYQGGVWRKELIEVWLEHTKLTEGNLAAFRAHPQYDDFWKLLNPSAVASQVHAPGIFIGGWYDIFVQGTIDSFVSIQHQGGERARGNCRLILGPWAHGTFEELKYPPESNQRPEAANPARYFEHFLSQVDNGVAKDEPVHYWVMGDPTDPDAAGNEWRRAADWPIPADEVAYYFHTDGGLRRNEKPASNDFRTYVFDPKNPVPSVGGQNLTIAKGPMDQRSVEERPDVLLFTSKVLTEPREITGRIRATLYVASDCPDTDFTVKLCDVYPDGRSMLVCDGIQRAKFRQGCEQAVPLEPGKVTEITVDLWSTSLVFNTGHRMRVAVSSSNSPRFEPNSNTGADAFDAERCRVANNSVHLSAEHPSSIRLPEPRTGP